MHTTARRRKRRRGVCTFIAAWSMLAAGALAAAGEPPLHERIDQLIEQANGEASAPTVAPVAPVAPIAPPVDDATFLRRVYLDLHGTIPPAARVRAFIADTSPDKRAAAVDELLASPRFAQHMADVFDIMLMERRNGKRVKQDEWRGYLVESFEQSKPYDRLVREVLSSDGADPATRARAAFYLHREAEPHLLTRDIGRIFLGRDLQCAQCHDHPSIDDFRQSEYYGLFAFFSRTTLFTDPKKVVMLMEKADGEVTYQSVFTKASYTAAPALPGDAPIDEPALTGDAAYKVKPAKNVRHVPAFSRREQLAIEATRGDVDAFNRNIANRLWKHMMGRGLVEPVDFHHATNPPSHPRLLALLAEAVVAQEYDVKAMLRQLALTRAYQRQVDPPAALRDADREALAKELGALRAQRDQLKAKVNDSFDALLDADDALVAAAKGAAKAHDALAAARKAEAPLKKAADETAKARADTQSKLAAAQKLLETVAAACDTAQQADSLMEDEAVKKAAALLDAKKKTLESQAKTLTDAMQQHTAAADAAQAKWDEAQQRSQETDHRRNAADETLDAKQQAHADVLAGHSAHQSALAQLDRRIEQVEAVIAFAAQDDSSFVAYDALLPHLSRRLVVRPLKPLTPQQLAWSMMEATGVVEAHRGSLPAELEKQAKDAAAKATAEARKKDKDAPAVEAQPVTPRQVEQALHDKLAGAVNAFVNVYAAADGQPQDTFFATASQALFIANGGTVQGWLSPKDGNLIDRLLKCESDDDAAQELYLSILTRQPDEQDIADVRDYLNGRDKDRAAAMAEMAWGLLTCAEFRFCR